MQKQNKITHLVLKKNVQLIFPKINKKKKIFKENLKIINILKNIFLKFLKIKFFELILITAKFSNIHNINYILLKIKKKFIFLKIE